MAFYTVDSGYSYWVADERYPFIGWEGIARSIVRASNGDMFFCYDLYPGSGGDWQSVLRKSTDGGLTWGSTEIITSDGDSYGLTIDSNDNIYAAFEDGSGNVKVRKRSSGGSWGTPVVIFTAGYPASIHVDSNDYIYVLEVTWSPGTVKLYKSTNGGTSFSLISTIFSKTTLRHSDLAIDSNDDLHVACASAVSPYAYYRKSTDGGSNWGTEETCDLSSSYPYTMNILVDGNNVPHILVGEGNNNEIWYSNRVGGSWSSQKLADVTDSGEWEIFPTFTIDRAGILYAMWCSGSDQQDIVMKYSIDGGYNWTAETNIWLGFRDYPTDYNEVWYPISMNAYWPRIGGVSTNIMASGWNCGMWYEDFITKYEYIKYGTGIVAGATSYGFIL